MIVVLDSSAMIAWLAGESEGTFVSALFAIADSEDEGISIYAHSANLCEVFYHVVAVQDVQTAEEAITLLKTSGVIECNDFDGDFWRDIAGLIVAGRQLVRTGGARAHLALGDACGVALANRLGGDFVTKDRTEIEPLHNAGLVSAQFIRA